MSMLISVEFTDGTRCEMIPAALNLFLQEKDWVRRFRRKNGWVWVGLSPMRSGTRQETVQVSDRRSTS